MTNTSTEGNLSFANKAVYHYDCYLLQGNYSSLEAAKANMDIYRDSGGTLFANVDAGIAAAIAAKPKKRVWARAPSLDRPNAEAWRHFWTGSLEWWQPGCRRDDRDNPLLQGVCT